MRVAVAALSVLPVVNWTVLFVAWRRNATVKRRLEALATEPSELTRRLVGSHLAARRLLAACSTAEAARVSAAFVDRRQALARAAAAVGELLPDDH